ERDREDHRVVSRGHGLARFVERELDTPVRDLARGDELAPKVHRALQSSGETDGDLLVAADDVIALVAEVAPEPDLRLARGLREEREREAAHRADFDAVLDAVRDREELRDVGTRAAAREPLAE